MVVIGNPPYSVSSSNKSEWIETLTADYKKDLNERNIQPLSDDYIKFIRFGQHFVEKNGEGVLAFITNNSFVDGVTHRQRRKRLLETFDSLYILDLHGSAKKNELSPDGGKDTNVFDIQQGVSINIFVKTKRQIDQSIKHYDLFGTREWKYEFLEKSSIKSISWNSLAPDKPYFFFVPKNFDSHETYSKGFAISELFASFACGIVAARDSILIKKSYSEAEQVITDFKSLAEIDFRSKYDERQDSRDWTYKGAKADAPNASIERIDYRPFDTRFVPYSPHSKGILSYPRNEVMSEMLGNSNVALLVSKQQSTFDFQHVFLATSISDNCTISSQTKEKSYHFPLYLYPDDNAQPTLDGRTERVPNLDSEIVERIAAAIGLTFVAEKVERVSSPHVSKGHVMVPQAGRDPGDGIGDSALSETEVALTYVRATDTLATDREVTDDTFAPIDILDYIYAVLHSPNYREKYKEFLKIDFPRVPYPKDAATFWRLVKLGGELRQIHLLESPIVTKPITGFPVGGDNIVEKIVFVTGPLPGTQAPSPASVRPDADEPGKHSTGKMPGTVTPEEPAFAGEGACVPVGDVYFSDTQYFSNVPETAWNFYIGGYQPAQKWLKDRKGCVLNYDDIQHYQKIIVALTETGRIMKEIDKTGIVDGN